MFDFLFYVFLLALLAVAVVASVWALRTYSGIELPRVALFGPRPEKRLAIVEHANVDGRRRLVLIRRDNVEHLIMTGGPVDVVIETGIGDEPSAVARFEASSPAAAYSRPARTFPRAAVEAKEVAE